MHSLAVETVDTLIIGAGVIGLACARELAKNNSKTVCVLEQNARSGEEISSHNSGVIHAGIYYPKHFLKSKLCIEGNRLLYQYAKEKGIPYQQTGKLIVASNAQRAALTSLYQQSQNNGVSALSWLEKDELRKREPNVQADIAIYSASTGIIDAAALVAQLEIDACAFGANVLFNHKVNTIEAVNGGYQVTVNNEFIVRCRCLVNAAGLSATALANKEQTYFAKGHYYSYQHAAPFTHLIYPLPEENQQGLGIHSTLDFNGQVQFGPDVVFQSTPNYRFDESRKEHFIQAIQRYYPGLHIDKLKPGQAGVRPKLSQEGAAAKDFQISCEKQGKARLVNLLGLESPGLTASLAIGKHVNYLLNE